MAGKDGHAFVSPYVASKAALLGFTKSLAKEMGTSGVLVNAIAPGAIDTEMIAGGDADLLARLLEMTPMGRVGRPEEVGELVAWLCSERCSYSTGAIYDISGSRAVC
jgi:NAD(P)-dependent dehydrogenase (short-subunit alcohol dehydrogenase family)